MKIITCTDGTKVKRVSRWIKLNNELVTPKSRFYDDSDNGEIVTFRHRGSKYSLNSDVMRLFYPLMYYDDNGNYLNPISGYIAFGAWIQYYVEIDDTGEAIRLYEPIREGEAQES